MVIVHENLSHVIVFEMYETTLFHLNQQTDKTTSNTEHMKKRSVSQEKLLEQQFHDLFLELNQGKQDEYFNFQEECNSPTEENILFYIVR